MMYMVSKHLCLTLELDSEPRRHSETHGVTEAELVRCALEPILRHRDTIRDSLEPRRTKAMTRIEQFWSTSAYRLEAGFERNGKYAGKERIEGGSRL